jgi:hypothetical protein
MTFRASAVFALGCALLVSLGQVPKVNAQNKAQTSKKTAFYQDQSAVVPDKGPEHGRSPSEEMQTEEGPSYEEGYYPSDWNGNGSSACGGYEDVYANCQPSHGGFMSRLFNSDSTFRQVMGRPGQIVVGADYLHVRANFSEATAYVEQNTDDISAPFDRFHQFDYNYDDSYRFFAGYRWNNCDEEIRFSFTRYTSSAGLQVEGGGSTDPQIIVREGVLPPGTTAFLTSSAEANSYDLGYSKTICLGSPIGCGDPCGCGDTCGCDRCPAWDITWYGGVRVGEVDWNSTYLVDDPNDEVGRTDRSIMNFEGIGPRVGLEGRRYMGRTGSISLFLRGDISLLVGHLDITQTRQSDLTEGQVISQLASFRNVIPVTDLEGGVSAHLTKNTTVSAGYLVSAWHDLGFREDFPYETNMGIAYDDANILAFDGLFVRLEAGF